MDEKLAKKLIASLDANTEALKEHAKLLSAITGKKAPPRAPTPAPPKDLIAQHMERYGAQYD